MIKPNAHNLVLQRSSKGSITLKPKLLCLTITSPTAIAMNIQHIRYKGYSITRLAWGLWHL